MKIQTHIKPSLIIKSKKDFKRGEYSEIFLSVLVSLKKAQEHIQFVTV